MWGPFKCPLSISCTRLNRTRSREGLATHGGKCVFQGFSQGLHSLQDTQGPAFSL